VIPRQARLTEAIFFWGRTCSNQCLSFQSPRRRWVYHAGPLAKGQTITALAGCRPLKGHTDGFAASKVPARSAASSAAASWSLGARLGKNNFKLTTTKPVRQFWLEYRSVSKCHKRRLQSQTCLFHKQKIIIEPAYLRWNRYTWTWMCTRIYRDHLLTFKACLDSWRQQIELNQLIAAWWSWRLTLR
jgi:hypothetical protein